MNGRSRRTKRTIIASALFFVAVQIATGVRAMMLRSGLSFCSKTTIPFTKSGLIRRQRPSILFLQTPDATTNQLWSNNSSRRRTFANRVRSSTQTNATAIAVSPKTNSRQRQRQRNTNRNLSSAARSPIAASSEAKSKSKTKQPRANIKKIAMPKRKGGGKTKFYAVARGRTPGIYSSWDECQAQVKGYPNVKFKSFATIEEAESYLANNNSPAPTQSSASANAATTTLSSSSGSGNSNNNNNTGVDAAFSKSESSGNSIESGNKKQRIDADQHRPLPRTLSGRKAAASILSNHSLLLWSSLHNEDSPEYVPRGSFARYVERNMERPEVRTNPVWKKHVEDEIDEMLAELTKSQSIGTSTHAINWNRVPLIALPMDEREQERKLENEEKSEGDDIDTGTTSKDSDETVADDDNGTDDTDNPPQPLPHKLFYHVMFDGGSRGNPHGHAGSGTHVVARSFYHDNNDKDGNQTKSKKEIIAQDKTNIRTYLGRGQLTNNQAEYQGLVTGLKHVRKALQTAVSAQRSASASSSGPLRSVTLLIQGDSDLIIKQMNGVYSCKSPKLRSYHQEAMELARCIREDCRELGLGLDVTFEHVYRTDNKIADALANEAMDAQRSWTTTATVFRWGFTRTL